MSVAGSSAAAAIDVPRWKRWLRLAVGSVALGLFAGLFMSGVTPPGPAGTVLRHNRELGIDASPLFYSEVEHMTALERAVRERRAAAARTAAGEP